VTIPAITNPGRNTFQFFSHYYVWQDTDHYWAEFDLRSNVQSFTIADPFSTPPTSTPTTTPTVPQLQPVPDLQAWIILPLITVAILLSIIFIRKRIPKKNSSLFLFFARLLLAKKQKRPRHFLSMIPRNYRFV